MKKRGNSRTSLLFQQEIITTCPHRPLIDPMLLIILILPVPVLLFLFLLSLVPKIIKPASIKSTMDCFNLFLVLLVILSCVFDPEDDDPSTNKVVENDQNLDVEGVKDDSHFYDSDRLMSDEEIDASGNSDDQRTPIPPPMPFIHANYYKLDPQVSDATAEITSSGDQRKRKRRQYRPKVKNMRRVTPIPPAPPPPPAPAPAPPPPPLRGQKSIFKNIFKKSKKAPQIPSVTTSLPSPPPPPPHSLFPNLFAPRNKTKNLPKNSKLPPRPPTRPPHQLEPHHYDCNTSTSSTSQSSWTPQPPQPKQEPQHYDRPTSMSCSSSESSYIPRPPPPPPFDMPEMRYKYYGNFVRLRSYNSNTSSSPDIQPMSQPSTSMDGGYSFWSSPDVNEKAGIFISKGKDQWKMEQENTVKKNGGPSFVNSIFKSGNKNIKLPSSKTSPLPPLPPTRSRPQPQPQHYYRQSSMSSSSQSSYIPQPPPLPPFDMPVMRYKYIGDHFARLRSFNSSTSSSPDFQPVGQPSTSMDGGDMLWSSPDVNAKADIFISKGKDKWKIEQENTVEKKSGTSFINKPRKRNLNSMKSHFYP